MTILAISLFSCFSQPEPEPVEEKPKEPKLTSTQINAAYFEIDTKTHKLCSESQFVNRNRGDGAGIYMPTQLCDIVGPARTLAPDLWLYPQFYCFTVDCTPSTHGFACLERSVLTCADLEIANQRVALAKPELISTPSTAP
jgi:hypothetical protein